jgi:DNA-binding NarL/FixJ family response regulator
MVMVDRTKKKYQVLLVDNRTLVRRGLRIILECEPDIAICGEATTASEAVELARRHWPDLVFLNPQLQAFGRSESTRKIHAVSPQSNVIMLTLLDSENLAGKAFDGDGLIEVIRTNVEKVVLEAVARVRARKCLPANGSTGRVCASGIIRQAIEDHPLGPSLSSRETQVLTLLADGHTTRETALSLGISNRTVESHRSHIMRKMKFPSYSHLIRFAVRNSLVAP